MHLILKSAIIIFFIGAFARAPQWIYAADDAAIDEIISGFEEASPEPSDTQSGSKTDPSEESEDIEEILEGFEDAGGKQAETEHKKQSTPSRYSLNGYLEFDTIVNIAHDAPTAGETDWRGLSSLRTGMGLDFKAKLSELWQARISGQGFYDFAYTIRGRDNYTQQVLDQYEQELELTDTYIQGSFTKNLDLKAGRQIVVWGRMDNLRVNDVLNPIDLRVPGLTDLEDLRLPVGMVRMDYYHGNWGFTGMVIPEIRFSKKPVFGSDFFPADQPLPPQDVPSDGLNNAGYAAAINGIFSGWDIAFYFADIYSDQTHIESGENGAAEQKHARIKMVGTASSIARGNWLTKLELALFDGLKFTNTPGEEFSRLDTAAGIEYSGFTEATVSVEVANRHIIDFDQALRQPPDDRRENEFQYALRATKTFINDTLNVIFIASTFGIKVQDGFSERLTAEYDLTDAIEITAGIVLYQSGDTNRFPGLDDNDRVFIEIKYSF